MTLLLEDGSLLLAEDTQVLLQDLQGGSGQMAVTGKLYGNMLVAAFNKEIDLLDDAITVTLHASGYVPDQDVHDYVNDLTNEVANGNGYTTGGKVLTSKTLTYTAGTNRLMFDAADLQWAAPSTFVMRVAAISDRTPGTAATQPLIAYQLSDADIGPDGGTFDAIWNANGLFYIDVA